MGLFGKKKKANQAVEPVSAFDAAMAAYRARDYVNALRLFEEAARRDDAAAQYNCGLLYEHGRGAAADPAAALRWYEKAAGLGHANAQFRCGKMYAAGEGTAQNLELARMWLQKSASQGVINAADALEKLLASDAQPAEEEAEVKPEEAYGETYEEVYGEAYEEVYEEAPEEVSEETPEEVPGAEAPSDADRLYAEGMAAIGRGDFAGALELFLESAALGKEDAQKLVPLLQRRVEAAEIARQPEAPEPPAEAGALDAEPPEAQIAESEIPPEEQSGENETPPEEPSFSAENAPLPEEAQSPENSGDAAELNWAAEEDGGAEDKEKASALSGQDNPEADRPWESEV